jgi:hypothetical protein
MLAATCAFDHQRINGRPGQPGRIAESAMPASADTRSASALARVETF